MVNGLEPNKMVLSRKLADGQCYGSKRWFYPGNYQMVNGMEANRWSTVELADGSDLDVKRRVHTENSRMVPGLEFKRWFHPEN